jgi:hypothetical protein
MTRTQALQYAARLRQHLKQTEQELFMQVLSSIYVDVREMFQFYSRFEITPTWISHRVSSVTNVFFIRLIHWSMFIYQRRRQELETLQKQLQEAVRQLVLIHLAVHTRAEYLGLLFDSFQRYSFLGVEYFTAKNEMRGRLVQVKELQTQVEAKAAKIHDLMDNAQMDRTRIPELMATHQKDLEQAGSLFCNLHTVTEDAISHGDCE